jgi:hypothetical protein
VERMLRCGESRSGGTPRASRSHKATQVKEMGRQQHRICLFALNYVLLQSSYLIKFARQLNSTSYDRNVIVREKAWRRRRTPRAIRTMRTKATPNAITAARAWGL